MFDFDPRDQDRDDERWGSDRGRGSRGASDTRDRDDDGWWPEREREPRDREIDPRDVFMPTSTCRVDWSGR